MKEKVISLRVGKLAEGKKSLLPNVFSALCGNKAGKMKYVGIEGVNLRGFEKKLLGADTDLYLDTLIDTISIVENMGIKDADCVLCSNDSFKVAKLFGVHLATNMNSDEIISKWASEEMIDNFDVYKEGNDSDTDWDEIDEDYSDADEEEDMGEEEVYEDSEEPEVNEEDEEPEVNDSEVALREEIKKVFNSTVISLVSKVKK